MYSKLIGNDPSGQKRMLACVQSICSPYAGPPTNICAMYKHVTLPCHICIMQQ